MQQNQFSHTDANPSYRCNAYVQSRAFLNIHNIKNEVREILLFPADSLMWFI